MMDFIAARLETAAAERAEAQRQTIAAQLVEALPGDVTITEEGETVVISGRRIGIRWLRDPAFAALRDGVGSLL